MRRFDRLVRDPILIDEMLKTFDHAIICMHDEEYPYAVPMNFGYDIKDGKLYIYFHTVKNVGHKIALLRKNPNVCVTFSKFFNFHDHKYRGSYIHDYRSVMAFGKVSLMEKGTPEFGNALVRLLAQADRKPNEFYHHRLKLIDMYVITCDFDDVYGKSEFPLRTVDDVPFTDVYSDDGTNTEPFDLTDLISKKQTGNWKHDWMLDDDNDDL